MRPMPNSCLAAKDCPGNIRALSKTGAAANPNWNWPPRVENKEFFITPRPPYFLGAAGAEALMRFMTSSERSNSGFAKRQTDLANT